MKRNNAEAAGSVGEDRISDLPDALLHHMLSLLPVHEAVQTSVLARRWLHLWKDMPVLRLVGSWKRFPSAKDCDRFVNRLISARGYSPLVRCEIEAYPAGYDYAGELDEPEANLYFNSRIQYALQCKVRVLRVIGDLVGSETELVVPLVSQHLTNLDVRCVCLEKDIVDFSCCPVLEELKLQECSLWVRNMLFPYLKRLFLVECNFPEDYRVSISAPNVVSLHLDVYQGKTPLLESMPLLETVCVDLSYWCKDQCQDCGGDEKCEGCHGNSVESYQSEVLNSQSNAINLELKDQPRAYTYKRGLKWCPIFGRLKTLLLDMWCRAIDLHALVHILQHTPIIEKLTLQLRSDENFLNAGQGERKHVQIEQAFACPHLKEVNIECGEKLRVKDKVRQIVKILSKSGITEKISFKKIPRPEGGYHFEVVFDDYWSGSGDD